MNKKGWILTVVIVFVCLIVAVSRNGNNAFGKTTNGSGVTSTQNQPPPGHYVSKQIVLSREWSSEPVQISNGQTINYVVRRGLATEYEVRDKDYPERVYKFHSGEIIHTDNAPIYNWQWRVSGNVNSGPVVLEYTIGTLY